MPVTDATIKRLCSILPMLGSSNDGETGNAVRALNKILKEADGHWTDVVTRLANGAKTQAGESSFRRKADPPPFTEKAKPHAEDVRPRRQKSAWMEDKEDVDRVFIRRGELDDWSREFLESIQDQVVHMGRSLTEKQRSKLNEILDKLGV
jgi:hypothetical protein